MDIQQKRLLATADGNIMHLVDYITAIDLSGEPQLMAIVGNND